MGSMRGQGLDHIVLIVRFALVLLLSGKPKMAALTSGSRKDPKDRSDHELSRGLLMLRILFHLLAQTERTHISPNLFYVREAFLL